MKFKAKGNAATISIAYLHKRMVCLFLSPEEFCGGKEPMSSTEKTQHGKSLTSLRSVTRKVFALLPQSASMYWWYRFVKRIGSDIYLRLMAESPSNVAPENAARN